MNTYLLYIIYICVSCTYVGFYEVRMYVRTCALARMCVCVVVVISSFVLQRREEQLLSQIFRD